MARVVHHQRTVSHLLLNQSRHVRIAIARRGRDACKSIPIDFPDSVARIGILDQCGHFISGLHVGVIVTVIAHDTDAILPITCIDILGVIKCFIDQGSGIIYCTYRKTAYCYIGLALIGIATAYLLTYLLVII